MIDQSKMNQYNKWQNNLEHEAIKIQEESLPIRKIEYKGLDRIEKQMECQAYKVTRNVTKAYHNRVNQKPFGIG